MSYSNIKRVMAAALLLAFSAPATFALSDYYGSSLRGAANNAVSMTLNGNVNLTDKNEEITLSLRDSDVKQVLRMFADKAGLNIVFHESVNGKVTLDLVQTPINEAFNLVLQIAGLNYYKQGNTMIILKNDAADNAAYSKQEMMVFPVSYVSADKIANFLNKNVFGMKKTGMSGVDAATVNSATNELIVFGMPSDAAIVQKVIAQFDREPYTRTFAVNHTTPAEMASMICDLLLPSRGAASSASGSGSSSSSSSSSSSGSATGEAAGIATGFASESSGSSNIKLGEGIVACSVSGQSGSSLAPFDVQNLSIAYFPQRGTITLMGGSEAQARMIENFIRTNDVKQPQAYLEVSIVELNEDGSKEFQNQWSISGKHWSANFDGTTASAGRKTGNAAKNAYVQTTEYIWNSPDGTKNPYTDSEGNVTIPQQITRTFMDSVPSVHVSWFINYIVQNRKGRVLANPKILITNGQESLIDLTQDYVEKVTSEYLTSSLTGAGSTGTVQRDYSISSDLGIKVSLTPFISPEGYVTLNIKPEYSTIASQVYQANETGGNDLAATLLSRRDLDLKNVRIKDGETLIIGGLIQESETKSVNKIPFLGDLPLIGPAFRSSSTSKSKSEMVIMITPKIIHDGEGAIADSI